MHLFIPTFIITIIIYLFTYVGLLVD